MTVHDPTPPLPASYRIQVDGLLDDRWVPWFDGLTLSREGNGTTCLRGPVPDQAALHGLLAKIRDLGITLISVEALDPPNTRPRQQL